MLWVLIINDKRETLNSGKLNNLLVFKVYTGVGNNNVLHRSINESDHSKIW